MNSLLQILDLFPAQTHPLTLVSDPDGLLEGEEALVELARSWTALPARRLFGGPQWIEWVTLGHFSRRWLVKAYLQ